MAYYDQRSAGKNMTSRQLLSPAANLPRPSDQPIDETTLDFNTRNGFILFKDVRRILDLPGAIGLRAYQLAPDGSSIMIVGVDEEGFELSDIADQPNAVYLSVNGASGRDDEAVGLDKSGAEDALVKLPSASRIIAFFFKQDLERLASADGGIGFFEIPLDSVDGRRVPAHIRSQDKQFRTFVAIQGDISGGQIQSIDLSGSVNNVVSVLPCPGQCTSIETIRMDPDAVTRTATDRYLRPDSWQRNA